MSYKSHYWTVPLTVYLANLKRLMISNPVVYQEVAEEIGATVPEVKEVHIGSLAANTSKLIYLEADSKSKQEGNYQTKQIEIRVILRPSEVGTTQNQYTQADIIITAIERLIVSLEKQNRQKELVKGWPANMALSHQERVQPDIEILSITSLPNNPDGKRLSGYEAGLILELSVKHQLRR